VVLYKVSQSPSRIFGIEFDFRLSEANARLISTPLEFQALLVALKVGEKSSKRTNEIDRFFLPT